uniref:Ig-like domain-containing protein n=1 Tax=Cyanoderma ruficeps TaxID=181631 RepID=A0A8C3P0Y8_9PASS
MRAVALDAHLFTVLAKIELPVYNCTCMFCFASKNAAAVTPVTAQPLLLTPEPWKLLVTQTPAKEKAKEGETVVLNCHLNSPQHPSLTDLMVKWYKEDEKGQMDLLEKNVMTILPNNSRIFMSGDLSQGDVSLIILNVTTSDHGIYFCEVTLPDGKVVTGDGTKLRIRRALGNTWSYLLFFPCFSSKAGLLTCRNREVGLFGLWQ